MKLNEITDDSVSRRIDISPLKRNFTPFLNKFIKYMEHYGYSLRIVGGAVRDTLLGKTPRDIDLLTDALPDEIMYLLEQHDIPYVTRGIPHGTIKIKFPNNEEYEITSLGFAISKTCCPPHIKVNSGRTWREDALRRDFTINAMSMDLHGNIYDYLHGYQDLISQHIRFIHSPIIRITNDPIIILRFFKLIAMFKNPRYDKHTLNIIKQHAALLKKIPEKRLALELETIKQYPNGGEAFRLMKSLGLEKYLKTLKENTLVETPIADINYYGEKESGSLRPDDIAITNSSKARDKITRVLNKTPVPISLHFVNLPYKIDINHHINGYKIGLFDKKDFYNIYHVELNIIPNVVNCVFVENEGTERRPFTPWMIAHRMFHIIHTLYITAHQKNADNADRLHKILLQTMTAFKNIVYLIQETENIYREDMIKLKPYMNAILTTKSGRENNLTNIGEILPEIFAQYCVTGKITFNELENNPRFNKIIHDYAKDFEMYFTQILQLLIGKIIVL